MKKRGTGWIPDYPDIQDYTLDSLANQIQSQGTAASIDNLAQEISVTFNQFFENQSKYNEEINNQLTQLLQEFINLQTNNNQQANSQLTQLLQGFINIQTNNNQQANSQLTQIRDNLEEKTLGDLRFVKVELHSVIEPGWAYSEVLLIKNYLQSIISTWRQFQGINYQTAITNNIFDLETQETVQKILKNQRCLQVDGFVDKDDMEALTILAQGVNLDREKQFFQIIKKNAEKYTPEEIDKYKAEIDKDNEPNSSFPKNPEQLNLLYQSLLTVYLFPIISSLPTTKYLLSTELYSDTKSEVKQELRNLEIQINEAKINLSNAIKKIENDRDFIEKIIVKFQAGLKKYFNPDELMYLTDLTNQGEGLTKKIIEPLNNLLAQYSKFDKSNIYNYREIIKVLSTTISEFEKMMELLYMAYPPEIPSENYQKTEMPIASPIPVLLVDLFKNKFSKIESAQLESSLLSSETKLSIQNIINLLENQSNSQDKLKLIRPIIEVLVQILMPVGQYSNLSEAVEQGIEKIWDLLAEKKDNQQEIQEIKGLIRETIEEYNLGTVRNYSLMTELSLKELISTALQKFDSDIQELKTANQNQAKQGESQNIAIQGTQLVEKKVTGKETRQLIKKPLFEITNLDEISRKINVATSSPENIEVSKSKTSSQQKNILQFPLSSQVRKDIQALKKPESSHKSIFLSLPEFVDLTYWCSPVEDQGPLNSCTAHAGVALMEYAEKKSSDTYTDASPLFLYRVTRNLMQREGDSGASVRDTIKAMVAFGVCPEVYWPYNEDKFDEEPTPFCYSFAENYKTIKYFRLDYGQISRYTLLSQVKVLLASEIPCIFGFTLYNSVYDEVNVLRGHIPLPSERSKVIGGHTVVAVGYHDRKIIENEDGEQSKGALLIRNSWGARWGQGGYGWLPYDYIMKGLTADWWSLLKAEWLATGRFGAGASAWNPDKGDRNGVTKPGQNG